ncbi:hypothetical protein B0H14DRAFT_3504193 [Mycena olivaceomarginata]|nr:hypothetical protein B0H14DRAFT_3504193 [Mycena olivaceomarginata]
MHLAAHNAACKGLTSDASHLPFDGESPEQARAALNPPAGSTRAMGPGKRHDFITDDSNLWEQVFQRQLLLRVDANFKLKGCHVKAKNAPGCHVELDTDGDKMPPLIRVDDDDDLTSNFSADVVIVKAKL